MVSPSHNNASDNQTVMSMTPSYQNRQIRQFLRIQDLKSIGYAQVFPQSSSSDHSSVTNTSITTAETNSTSMIKFEYMDPFEIYPVIDENSWSEPQVVENSSMPSNYLDDLQFPFPSADTVEPAGSYGYAPDTDDDMKFWHNFFVKSQGIE